MLGLGKGVMSSYPVLLCASLHPTSVKLEMGEQDGVWSKGISGRKGANQLTDVVYHLNPSEMDNYSLLSLNED